MSRPDVRTRSSRLASLALFAVVPLSSVSAQEPQAAIGAEGNLRRLPPVPVQVEGQASDSVNRIFKREFDPAEWERRLVDPDLDAREKSFADLLRRARLDPMARAFLERRAKQTDEVAWTVRLALRELGAPSFSSVPIGADSKEFHRQFESMFRELAGESPELFFMTPRGRRVRVLPAGVGETPGHSKSVRVRQGPNGARILVTEVVGGREQTTRYDGSSLQAILEANPALADMVHLSSKSVQEGLDLELSLPSIGEGLLDPFEYGERKREAQAQGEWFDAGDGPLEEYFSPGGARHPVRTDILGVQGVRASKEEMAKAGLPGGVVVVALEPGTIADFMGVRAGDTLVQLNGKPLIRPAEITERLNARGPDARVSLRWLDDLGRPRRGAWPPKELRRQSAAESAPSAEDSRAD